MNFPKQTAIETQADRRFVFICYAPEDENIARTLCEKLEAAGFSVWYKARDVEPGGFIPSAAEKAILQSGVFILILSKFSAKSESLRNELAYEIQINRDDSKAMVLPIFLFLDQKVREFFRHGISFDASEPPLDLRLEQFVQWLQNGEFAPGIQLWNKMHNNPINWIKFQQLIRDLIGITPPARKGGTFHEQQQDIRRHD